jgi:hypothetical protein
MMFGAQRMVGSHTHGAATDDRDLSLLRRGRHLEGRAADCAVLRWGVGGRIRGNKTEQLEMAR